MMTKALPDMALGWARRLSRYTAVAIFCAALHNAILITMDAIDVHYVWCQAASAAVLLPTGYFLQGSVTFSTERSLRGFLRYSTALFTNFPVAIVSLWLLRDLFVLPMTIAAPVSTIILFAWNYLTSFWAFRPGMRGSAIIEVRHG